MNTTHPTHDLIRHGGAFIGLATIVMSLWVIPEMQAHGYGAIGYLATAVLALGCVGVVYDRLNRLFDLQE